MIHILTVHWQSSEWIDIQLKYLHENISSPFRVYAFLNGIPDVGSHLNKFFYTCTENIKPHAIKLNLLADIACFAADSEEDYLMFLDGDAFPVAPIDKLLDQVLVNHPLAAIQRTENNGDLQPHPCFCMIKIKTWKQIQGDWNHGGVTWKDKFGKKVWDVGGLMLEKVNSHNIDWYKLHRSVNHNLHPLLFGVYDNLIYHHGAAFRQPGTRVDKNSVDAFDKKFARFKKAKKYLPLWLARKLFLPLKYEIVKNRKNSKLVFDLIQKNTSFYKQLESLE